MAQVVQQLQPTENKINTFDKLIKRPQDNPTIGILICQKAAIEREESQAVD